MDWTSVAPYLVATLAFLRWPTLWIVVVLVSACSVHRGRAALTAGVATIIFLAFLLDADIARPHLELANYGHVIFAAAVLAPWLMLPSVIWPPRDAEPRVIDPPGTVRRGFYRILAVPTLVGAVVGIDLALGRFFAEPSDDALNLYILFLMLPMFLAARLIAGGTWMVSGPVLGRWPRVRRSVSVAAVATLVVALYGDRTIPEVLLIAGDLAGDTYETSSDLGTGCATVDAYPEHGALHLRGNLCHDTPAAFDTVHATHPQIRRILLDSAGGKALAGLDLGRRLQELDFEARVDHQCSSACVTAFVGAKRRYVGPEGWVGIHQGAITSWAEGGKRARWAVSGPLDVESFHQERGITPALELRASLTPPDYLDVLSNEDLITYNIAQPTTDAPWLPLPPEQPVSDANEASP